MTAPMTPEELKACRERAEKRAHGAGEDVPRLLATVEHATARAEKAPCASHELFVGALVDWLHTPRGGYGFSVRIPAEVVALNLQGDRAVIAIETKASGTVTRAVSNEKLCWRTR